MTEPMNAEAVAQMVVDMQAGTPGPWTVSALRTKKGVRGFIDAALWGKLAQVVVRMHGDVNECEDGLANARRIARLPDLEAAYLALAAENAELRSSEAAAVERARVLEGLLVRAQGNVSDDFTAWHDDANAALTPTTDKEPKT